MLGALMTAKWHSNGYYVLLGGWRLLWAVFAAVILLGIPTLAMRLPAACGFPGPGPDGRFVRAAASRAGDHRVLRQ